MHTFSNSQASFNDDRLRGYRRERIEHLDQFLAQKTITLIYEFLQQLY